MHLLLVIGFVCLFGLSESSSTKSPGRFERFFRFANTVSYFNKIKLPFIGRKTQQMTTAVQVSPGAVLWATSTPREQMEWGPLDDIVMGGVSKTALEPGQFVGIFKGIVSTENNGGFAGIRTKLLQPTDISACSKFKLRVMGDGKRYKFIARDDEAWNGIAWSFSFDTQDGKWIDVSIPIAELKPTKFARLVKGGQPFQKKSLRGLQLTLSKFEYEGSLNPKFTPGRFELNLAEIGVE